MFSLGAYYFYRPADTENAELNNEESNQEKVKALLPVVLNSMGSNDYETAFKAVEEIYRLYPDNTSFAVWYYGLKAKIDHDIQKFKEAISALEKRYPNDLFIRLAKIVIYHEEQDHEREAREKQFIFKNLNDEVMWKNLPPYLYSLGASQSLVFEFSDAALKKYPQNKDLNSLMSSLCENYLKNPGKSDYLDQKENLEKTCRK